MSYDFLDDACEKLDVQEYPYVIVLAASNGTQITVNCDDKYKYLMAEKLENLAQDLRKQFEEFMGL